MAAATLSLSLICLLTAKQPRTGAQGLPGTPEGLGVLRRKDLERRGKGDKAKASSVTTTRPPEMRILALL